LHLLPPIFFQLVFALSVRDACIMLQYSAVDAFCISIAIWISPLESALPPLPTVIWFFLVIIGKCLFRSFVLLLNLEALIVTHKRRGWSFFLRKIGRFNGST
jgi:hypothetical protein